MQESAFMTFVGVLRNWWKKAIETLQRETICRIVPRNTQSLLKTSDEPAGAHVPRL